MLRFVRLFLSAILFRSAIPGMVALSSSSSEKGVIPLLSGLVCGTVESTKTNFAPLAVVQS